MVLWVWRVPIFILISLLNSPCSVHHCFEKFSLGLTGFVSSVPCYGKQDSLLLSYNCRKDVDACSEVQWCTMWFGKYYKRTKTENMLSRGMQVLFLKEERQKNIHKRGDIFEKQRFSSHGIGTETSSRVSSPAIQNPQVCSPLRSFLTPFPFSPPVTK